MQKDLCQIVPYDPKYDRFLSELDRKTPQGSYLQLEMVRDQFLSRARVFEDYRVCVFLDSSGLPVGAGASAIVPMLLNGRNAKAGFGFDVKVLPAYRKLHFASRYAAYAVEQHFKPAGCEVYFLTSKKTNRLIMANIIHKLMPLNLWEFVYLTLPTGLPLRPGLSDGKPQQLFVDLLNGTQHLQAFFEVRDGGLGIWHLHRCYRLRIRYIHPLLRMAILLKRFFDPQSANMIPKEGQEMRMAALFNIREDNLVHVDKLLPDLAAQGIQYLLVCCRRNDIIYQYLRHSSINTYDYYLMGNQDFSAQSSITMDVRCL